MSIAEVKAERLGKSFGSQHRRTEVLSDIEFDISSGAFVSVIGPSGCGKSTLLRLIAGLITPDAGEISVVGDSPQAGRRAKKFGLVPQTPALLPWRSVRKNLTLMPGLGRRKSLALDDIDQLLESVGLADFADALPTKLSGGMQQRVSLARAFALRPPILLMDEPFAALDEITRSQMRFLLLKLWADTGATVIFVTHSIEEAVLLSDRVLVMASRPGPISADVHIDLPRPRHHGIEDDEGFHRHTAALRAALNHAAAVAPA